MTSRPRFDPELIEIPRQRRFQQAVRTYEDVIELGTGSPPFGVPDIVKDAILARVDEVDQLSYPPTAGLEDLRTAIAIFEKEHLGVDRKPSQIVVTHGAMQALFDSIRAIVSSPTDEVLLPTPYWFQFPNIVSMAGATPVDIVTMEENQFKLTPAQLAAAIGENTRVLVLTTPNNPTGVAYSTDELEALAQVIETAPQLIVISDEVYNLLRIGATDALEPSPSTATIESIAARVLAVNSYSKNQAMSGLRVGYVSAPEAWVDPVTQVQRFTSLGVDVYTQAGALAATLGAADIVLPINGKLERRLLNAVERMRRQIPLMSFSVPEWAYYLWTDVSAYMGATTPQGEVIHADEDLADYLYEYALVGVVAGSSCGQPGWFRLTYAIPMEEFNEAVDRMQVALDQLTLQTTPASK